MDIKSIVDKLSISYVSDDKIKIIGKTYTMRQFNKFFTVNITKFTDAVDNPEKKLEILNNSDNETYIDKLFTKIIYALKDSMTKKDESTPNSKLFPTSYNYSNHNVIIDITNNEKLVFDKSNVQATDLDYDAFMEWVRTQEKPIRESVMVDTVRGIIEYNPYTTKAIGETVSNERIVPLINAHVTPKWRKKKVHKASYPKEFKDFMSHFLPFEDSRYYVLDWMHNMLTSRNECHLLLHGKKGTGKGTFASICRRLVGAINYKTIDKGFWDNRFNGELKYRRVCYFDEHDITRENKDYFKAYANPSISIEEKGKNVGNDIINHASYIISNNNPQGNYLEMDDRRFSVPEIADRKLEHVFGDEWVEAFVDKIENDDDFIANIGWKLLERKPTWNVHKPFKSEMFYTLVTLALTEWQRKLVERIEKRAHHRIPIEGLKDFLNIKMDIGRAKIERFLDSHVDRDNEYYASIKQDKDRTRWIVPNEKYQPEGNIAPSYEQINTMDELRDF